MVQGCPGKRAGRFASLHSSGVVAVPDTSRFIIRQLKFECISSGVAMVVAFEPTDFQFRFAKVLARIDVLRGFL